MQPILCKKCGTLFSSPLSAFGKKQVTLKRARVQCPNPNCRNSIEIIPDGTYDFDDDGRATLVEDIRKLNLSPEQIEELKDAVISAQKGGLSVESFKAKIETLSPSLLKVLQGHFISAAAFVALLSMLLLIIPMLNPEQSTKQKYPVKAGVNSTNNQSKIKDIAKKENRKQGNLTDTAKYEARKAHREYLKKQKRSKK